MIPSMRRGSQTLKPFLEWLPLENAKILEVGCFAGDGTVEFLQSEKVSSVTCVDLFAGGYDKADTASNSDMSEAMIKWMGQVIANNTARKPVTLMAYQCLMDASLDARNKYFDLIYIDGSHLREAVMSDLSLGLALNPKIIAGHDYGQSRHPGVMQAVNENFSREELYLFEDTSWAVKL